MKTYMPKDELPEFVRWLRSQDYRIEPAVGEYEVLRWETTKAGAPKPIVFRRDKTDMLTLNVEAAEYYLDWKDGFT